MPIPLVSIAPTNLTDPTDRIRPVPTNLDLNGKGNFQRGGHISSVRTFKSNRQSQFSRSGPFGRVVSKSLLGMLASKGFGRFWSSSQVESSGSSQSRPVRRLDRHLDRIDQAQLAGPSGQVGQFRSGRSGR